MFTSAGLTFAAIALVSLLGVVLGVTGLDPKGLLFDPPVNGGLLFPPDALVVDELLSCTAALMTAPTEPETRIRMTTAIAAIARRAEFGGAAGGSGGGVHSPP